MFPIIFSNPIVIKKGFLILYCVYLGLRNFRFFDQDDEFHKLPDDDPIDEQINEILMTLARLREARERMAMSLEDKNSVLREMDIFDKKTQEIINQTQENSIVKHETIESLLTKLNTMQGIELNHIVKDLGVIKKCLTLDQMTVVHDIINLKTENETLKKTNQRQAAVIAKLIKVIDYFEQKFLDGDISINKTIQMS